jgi:hypothetical protein
MSLHTLTTLKGDKGRDAGTQTPRLPPSPNLEVLNPVAGEIEKCTSVVAHVV